MAKASDNEFPKVLLTPLDPATITVPAGAEGLVLDSTDGNALKRVDDAGTVTAIEGSGGGVAATYVGCKALRTASQSLTSASAYIVGLTAADLWDTDGIHDPASNNTRLTIPTGMSGIWRFTFNAYFSANSNGYRMIYPLVNGTAQDDRAQIAATSNECRVPLSVDLDLTAGDYVEFGTFAVFASGTVSLTRGSVSAQYLGAP